MKTYSHLTLNLNRIFGFTFTIIIFQFEVFLRTHPGICSVNLFCPRAVGSAEASNKTAGGQLEPWLLAGHTQSHLVYPAQSNQLSLAFIQLN